MRVANHGGRASLLVDDGVVDLERASDGRFSADPQALYECWDDLRAWAGAWAGEPEPFDPGQLRLPVPRPTQVFGIGLNYAAHAAEGGQPNPEFPPTFTKFPTCLTGPDATVALPSDQVDWEVELVVVIGRRAQHVAEADGWSHVAGLTIGQDLSERAVQRRPPVPQFSLGKSFPGFGPTGPWVVTPDELADPDDLGISCTLNGEEVQNSRTSDLIFSVPALINRLSSICPLLPGDLIFTGTPSGVGFARTPPRFLAPGDEVVSRIEGIGELRTILTGSAFMSYAFTGFEGKVAVVTGAGRMRSIGRPIAVELARAGCDVVLTGTGRAPDRYPDDEKAAGWGDIDSVADEVRAQGRRALPVVSDVSDQAAVERLAAQVVDAFGRVDIVVNNAGAARGDDRRPVLELDPQQWRTVIDVNLTGSFLMSQVFGRRLVDAGRGGSIVNMSSIAGKRMAPGTAAYAASKAGLQALTAVMAREVASAGVRVNAVCPGVIDTSRMDDLGRGEEWDRLVAERIPLGRPGTGLDIAATVIYLCSDQGAWVTGQAWNVDGGSVVEH